ncbi:MAG TPA: M56 family metallopeptidase [Candidatus Cybelea sp.]|jgi:TonB family protein|nr:M56 family metallopeptidase [Candidatus Cybelea sp.]
MTLSILFNGLWQGAPIVAIGLVLSSLVPQKNATTRSALWLLTLIALAIVPVLTAVASANGATLPGAFHPHSAATASYRITLIPIGGVMQRADAWLGRFEPWILAAWLVGVGANALRLCASLLSIARIRRTARPSPGAGPGVLVSDVVAIPIVAGLVQPAIVIPQDLPGRITPSDLARIVAHERAHVRRHDGLWNLVARTIEAVLFFNPWVRLACVRLCEEREVACDDWVVANAGGAGEYAGVLAALAQSLRAAKPPLLTPSALRSRHSLVRRIERLGADPGRRLTINPYAIGGTLVIFAIATIVLSALSPALALAPTGNTGAAGAVSSRTLAASCANPNVEATVKNPVPPQMPHGFKQSGKVDVVVTIAANGHVTGTKILTSSGNAAIDAAIVKAARESTYSPKMVKCQPVAGWYDFHVEFKPN